MKVLVEIKGSYIIFFILVFLFTGFSIAADTKDKQHISPEKYYASNSFSWMQLFYSVDFADLYGKKINQLKAAYDTLSSDNYYEIHTQSLDIPFFPGKDVFLYGYEEGHENDAINHNGKVIVSSVKTVQLSKNGISRFNLSLWRGEFFSSDDYYDGDIVPVLLGYEYKGIFDIGDEIDGSFIFKPFKFKVIGILNIDSNIMISGEPLYLDRYIVMPSIECLYSPASKEEDLFQVRHYVNKLGGWFEYSNRSDLKTFNHKISEVNKIIPGKIEAYQIEDNSNIVDSIFSSIISIKNAVFFACIFIAIIISIICPLFYLRLQVKSISLLCVNIISGINYKDIIIKSVLVFILILVLSNITTFLILLIIGVNFTIWILAIDVITVVMLILLNFFFLNQTKLILYMGGADFAANTRHF